MKNPLTIIRIGLAAVFLANAITAFFAPQEFRELLGASLVSHFLPFSVATAVALIGLNDLALSALIVAGAYPRYILLWAMLWLVGVMTVIATIPGVLEHLGYFSMALALWMNNHSRSRPRP